MVSVPIDTAEPDDTSPTTRDDGDRPGRMSDQNDYVMRTMEERRVRFVQLWFTDVLGSLKS